MRRAGGVIAAVAGAVSGAGAGGCQTPTPSLLLPLTDGESQVCPSTDCAMVPMPCPTVMSIRIFDPENPALPLHEQCKAVPEDMERDMCALGNVELDPVALPVRRLEVQVAVYPSSTIKVDPVSKKLVCPPRVKYSTATRLPIEQSPTPALGGLAYYQPGDTEVKVELGCTHLESIRQSCNRDRQLTVISTVEDFSTRLLVKGNTELAPRLRLFTGEPRLPGGVGTLTPSDTRSLDPVAGANIATWRATTDLVPMNHLCVEVLDDMRPTTVRCKVVDPSKLDGQIDVTGGWISEAELGRILGLLSPDVPNPQLPREGLTIGIVVYDHEHMTPAPGFVVQSTTGTVSYLTSGGALGGTSTSESGIFVSRDAIFGTVFSTRGHNGRAVSGIGGLILGKVTLVILAASGSSER